VGKSVAIGAGTPSGGIENLALPGKSGDERIAPLPLFGGHGHGLDRGEDFVDRISQDVNPLPIALAGKVVGRRDRISSRHISVAPPIMTTVPSTVSPWL
jgi:hypothetical protein